MYYRPKRAAEQATWAKVTLFFMALSFLCPVLHAQESTEDTLKGTLQEVLVNAYEQGKPQLSTAVPVAVLGNDLMDQQQTQSAVQAINAIPGVRMDERSPGSYRLNIRGSAMRAPFGVRNVKVYYNGIPFTEPGGTSYLNQLGLLNFSNAEIIKGPGSSMYGAGTGGVLLLQHLPRQQNSIELGYAGGSYGMHTLFADIHLTHPEASQHVSYQQNTYSGYRAQSRLNRGIFNWDALYKFNDYQHLQTTVMYGNLYYQTPGALTLAEYEKDPQTARPATGNFPSAQQAGAAIRQQMVVSGLTLSSKITDGFSNKTSAYAAYTYLENAAIRNYSYNEQPHGGARSSFRLGKTAGKLKLTVHIGGELQTGASVLDVYDNIHGAPGTQQKQEVVRTTTWFGYAQANLSFAHWELLTGISVNNRTLKYQQSFPSLIRELTTSYQGMWTPRISLSRALHKNVFVYGLLSKGFSPPITDELLPSGSAFNRDLQPEKGRSYELGFRYYVPGKVYLELNGYYFRLEHTIVQQRDAGGGDDYLNAGHTLQPGIEFSGQYIMGKAEHLQSIFKLSYAYQPYTYGCFIRDDEEYTGKALPGVAMHNLHSSLQLTFYNDWRLAVRYDYNSDIPLNDANTVIGDEMHLVTAKLGYHLAKGKYHIALFAGVDNLLNNRYSLGYDINAAGNRFYNAAPDRNYYGQLILSRK